MTELSTPDLNSGPLVSVLIPAWNAAPWLEETLLSVQRQSFTNFECIIVDDGSTDKTAQVAASFVNKDLRFHLIRQENAGECGARNRALAEARGRFIAFLDADDYWDFRFLEKMLRACMQDQQTDLVFCRYTMFTDGTNLRKPQPWTNLHATGNSWWDMLMDTLFCMGAWVCRAEAVRAAGPFTETLHIAGDRDFLLRLLAHIYACSGCKAVAVPESLLYYRQRPGSAVRQSHLALRDEWQMMQPHIEHSGVPQKIRARARSNLAFKMAAIATFGCGDFLLALRWYTKAVRLAPLNLNLYWLPIRKLIFSLLPTRPIRRTILFLTLRADFGGGPEHLWQLLKNLPAGVQACVACPKDYPYYDRYRACVGDGNIFVLPHRKFSLVRLWKLRGFCRAHGVAVLHSHGKGAGLYARLLAALTGIPCAHTFHGVHTAEYSAIKKILYRLYERGMSLFTKAGITVSEGERAQILTEGLLPEAKLHLIENGVVIPNVPVEAPTAAPYRVVSFSRFDYQKNSLFLIDILDALERRGRIQDFQFVIVGDGPDRSHIIATAHARGPVDALVCADATPEPHAFFAGALCYLSTSRWEGMPLAVLEAMAHGLPAVVTDVVGNRDAVWQGETGFLYPEGDAEAAAKALCRLADKPELRWKLSEQAREYVAHRHNAQDMAETTLCLIQEIVDKSARVT